jgi:dTDP-4-amino-4,6-dideoxygalactose transaminase
MIRIPGIDEETRNRIITVMAEKGVVTNVHYKPLPMMTAYGADCSEYPNSYDYYRNLITLPLHTLLSEENVERVCQTLKEALTEVLGANHDLEKVG